MEWTADRIDALKTLLATPGMSFLAASQKMTTTFCIPVTRSMVLGKARRLGLTSTNPPNAPVERKPALERRRGAMTSGLIKAIKNRTGDDATMTGSEAKELPREDFPMRLSLLAARDGQCRWPAADDGSAHEVCGALVIAGRSWCAHHAALSVRRATVAAMEDA